MNGNEIRQARERAGLTQGELGELVGVSGRTIGNWERHASIPRNRQAKLVEVLGGNAHTEPASHLQEVSDATLLAEIARRFDEGRTRGKAGEGSEDSSPSMKYAEGNSAAGNITELFTDSPATGVTASLGDDGPGVARREQ